MCVPLITEGYCETKAPLVDKHNSIKDLKAFSCNIHPSVRGQSICHEFVHDPRDGSMWNNYYGQAPPVPPGVYPLSTWRHYMWPDLPGLLLTYLHTACKRSKTGGGNSLGRRLGYTSPENISCCDFVHYSYVCKWTFWCWLCPDMWYYRYICYHLHQQ